VRFENERLERDATRCVRTDEQAKTRSEFPTFPDRARRFENDRDEKRNESTHHRRRDDFFVPFISSGTFGPLNDFGDRQNWIDDDEYSDS